MPKPFFSVVTVCLNSDAFIRDVIESVESQQHDGVEHIIVDGGSTDKTLSILGEYPHLRLISEPDEGIYDAMNKGIRHAQGEVIALVNGDDRLGPGALAKVRQAFDGTDADVVSGAVRVINESNGELGLYPLSGARLSAPASLFGIPFFNARFFRRSVFDRVGYLRHHLRPTGDREFLLRLLQHDDIKRVGIEEIVYEYRYHAGSETLNAEPETKIWIAEKHLDLASRLEREAFWTPSSKAALSAMRRFESLKLPALCIAYGQIKEARRHLMTLGGWSPKEWSQIVNDLARWRRYRGKHAGA